MTADAPSPPLPERETGASPSPRRSMVTPTPTLAAGPAQSAAAHSAAAAPRHTTATAASALAATVNAPMPSTAAAADIPVMPTRPEAALSARRANVDLDAIVATYRPPKRTRAVAAAAAAAADPSRARRRGHDHHGRAPLLVAPRPDRSRRPVAAAETADGGGGGGGGGASTPVPAQRWVWTRFSHPARTDRAYPLSHWAAAGDPQRHTSRFAAFATVMPPVAYTDTEYDEHLRQDGWTQVKTDALCEAVQQFHLRWDVVHDAWSGPETMEDLKARYYRVQQVLLRLRAPDPRHPDVRRAVQALHFDHARETQRKQHVAQLYRRSAEQIQQEEALYHELLRYEAMQASWHQRRELVVRELNLTHPVAKPAPPPTAAASPLPSGTTTPTGLPGGLPASGAGGSAGPASATSAGMPTPGGSAGGSSGPTHAKAPAGEAGGPTKKKRKGQHKDPAEKARRRREKLAAAAAAATGASGSAPLIASQASTPVPEGPESDAGGIGSSMHLTSATVSRSASVSSLADHLPTGIWARTAKLPLMKPSLLPKYDAIVRGLGVPLMPVMPTAEICDQYAQLMTSIQRQMDLSKALDATRNLMQQATHRRNELKRLIALRNKGNK
ncbi:hypothetical protein CXG81DRAFT_20347 [Caulochytrium protostelioides]|uniref:SWR1-complex protein 4 n=1 Tax=Caulochytrium protostelioides TaxID=1555241 RepID=A0A4P9X3K0_9FUNG|nr:hypothetical protein CXG81DRAFT_20347 [Caulochytrium protostelioides]|eukprot:RKO99594.1 hypothetical protein CXG81DRAFT_20347 [Caulochytrium protostelioides]